MKPLFVILLSLGTFAYAADQSSQAAKEPAGQTQIATNPTLPALPPDAQVVKKMGAVTWDPDAQKLQWTVQTGHLVDGKFVAVSEDKYEISPDEATMRTSDEKRGFDGDEAEGLHQLLDILSLYCAESVAWWDQGLGDPVPSNQTKPGAPAQKPVKVHQPETKPAAPRIPGTVVAELKAM